MIKKTLLEEAWKLLASTDQGVGAWERRRLAFVHDARTHLDKLLPQDAWIQTFSGKEFRPFDPRPEMVDIEDVAHALSNIARFNGHAAWHYSVGQHSCLVSDRAESRRLSLLGLLHDAAEAYCGDIVTPIKRHVGAFEEIEDRIQAVIYEALRVEPPSAEEQAAISHLDLRALSTEKRDLHWTSPRDWQLLVEPFEERIARWAPTRAVSEFMSRWNEQRPW